MVCRRACFGGLSRRALFNHPVLVGHEYMTLEQYMGQQSVVVLTREGRCLAGGGHEGGREPLPVPLDLTCFLCSMLPLTGLVWY